MTMLMDDHARLRNAWQGRISGCMLGKPVEVLSMREGHAALTAYLERAGALPLREYVPFDGREPLVAPSQTCCRDLMTRSEPDDDIHYSVLALMMLERHGRALSTVHVAQTWLRNLPAAATYTAERAAYRTLLMKGDTWFAERGEPGFDLAECADNPYNDWIGAQIRADVYGWVAPGDPELAARLATADAALSHRGDGIGGAVFVAVAGSQIPVCASLDEAVERSLAFLDAAPGARKAVEFGMALTGDPEGGAKIPRLLRGSLARPHAQQPRHRPVVPAVPSRRLRGGHRRCRGGRARHRLQRRHRRRTLGIARQAHPRPLARALARAGGGEPRRPIRTEPGRSGRANAEGDGVTQAPECGSIAEKRTSATECPVPQINGF